MHVSTWIGYHINNLLFYNLNISSVSGFLIVCVCTFITVVLYESLKICSASLKLKSAFLKVPNRQRCLSDDTVLITNVPRFRARRNLWRFSEVIIYVLEISLGYILMLLAMTNFYLLLVLVLATGVCFALFGQHLLNLKLKTSKLKAPCEHCLKHGKESSQTSSTEVITEGIFDGTGGCCSHSTADVSIISS